MCSVSVSKRMSRRASSASTSALNARPAEGISAEPGSARRRSGTSRWATAPARTDRRWDGPTGGGSPGAAVADPVVPPRAASSRRTARVAWPHRRRGGPAPPRARPPLARLDHPEVAGQVGREVQRDGAAVRATGGQGRRQRARVVRHEQVTRAEEVGQIVKRACSMRSSRRGSPAGGRHRGRGRALRAARALRARAAARS